MKVKNTPIPFYPNTLDNTHCFQATIKMIAKHYFPSDEYTWDELDIFTAKAKDLWTWPMAGALWMQSKGVEALDIEVFDYGRFVDEKEQYVLDFFGTDVGSEQIKHSNVPQELTHAKAFQEKVAIQNRVPTITDIKSLLDDGYLLICCLNHSALNLMDGYVGHFVVVKGYDDEGVVIHDPGLSAYENRSVSYNIFDTAWSYPEDKVRNILAFRLPDNRK